MELKIAYEDKLNAHKDENDALLKAIDGLSKLVPEKYRKQLEQLEEDSWQTPPPPPPGESSQTSPEGR